MRIHDSRHGFASRTPALSESLPMIGKPLGHAQVRATAKTSASKIADIPIGEAGPDAT